MATGKSCPPKQIFRILKLTWLSPSIKRGQPVPLFPLTEEQRQFAADNHDLIYTFLQEQSLDIDGCYDVVVFGYLRAVERYLTEPGLRRYQFSTVAWRAMRQSMVSYYRSEVRRTESERRYWEQNQRPDPFEVLDAGFLLRELAAVSSREQYALVAMRLQGYSIAEAAQARQTTPKRVRKLLRELYRSYLQRYKNGREART